MCVETFLKMYISRVTHILLIALAVEMVRIQHLMLVARKMWSHS